MDTSSPSRIIRLALFAVPIAVLLALLIGPIIRHGMFIDGLVYTNLAKNMAAGEGSPWQPFLDVGGPVFYEHPVLVPWIHSFFFRLFGEGPHTEDIFNFTVLALTIFVMYRLWRAFVAPGDRHLFFFPLLLFALAQEVQLRYANTMLECGMTLAALATAWAFVSLIRAEKRQYRWASWAVVGLGTMVATLSKGPTGLFLLALPLLYDLIVVRKLRPGAPLVPAGVFAGTFLLLFLLQPEARLFFEHYLDQQVLAALRGERTENIADSRLAIFRAVVMTNLPAWALLGLVRVNKPFGESSTGREGWWLITVGLSAVLPIVVSIKQASYYQLPALPFFFLGGSLLVLSRLRTVVGYMQRTRLRRALVTGMGIVGLLAGLFVAGSMYGTTDRRDRTNRELADKVAFVLKEKGYSNYSFATTGDHQVAMSYSLPGFLNRFHDIYVVDGAPVKLILRTSNPITVPASGEVLLRNDNVILLAPE